MFLNIAVVLYNGKLEDIAGLPAFLRIAETGIVRIVVADNSIDDEIKRHNAVAATNYGDKLMYIDNGGNVGLPKAFNTVIPLVESGDYLMLADDDTCFSNEYLDNVVKEIKTNNSDVITGIVHTGNNIMSPKICFTSSGASKYFVSVPGKYKNIYAINSGLVLSKRILDAIEKFPDELFLDMVDYWLMDKLILLGLNNTVVVSGDIRQDFSGEQGYSSAVKRRFEIYKKDVRAYAKLIPHRRLKCTFILFKRRISILKKKLFRRG